ncbi:hypothetical protein DFH09DRAFT_1461876 [Mycena vulgaris]|nr:hypothetical protein DFH09DRAFT_1461876 [Mycena vulgaris]
MYRCRLARDTAPMNPGVRMRALYTIPSCWEHLKTQFMRTIGGPVIASLGPEPDRPCAVPTATAAHLYARGQGALIYTAYAPSLNLYWGDSRTRIPRVENRNEVVESGRYREADALPSEIILSKTPKNHHNGSKSDSVHLRASQGQGDCSHIRGSVVRSRNAASRMGNQLVLPNPGYILLLPITSRDAGAGCSAFDLDTAEQSVNMWEELRSGRQPHGFYIGQKGPRKRELGSEF